MLLTVLLVFIPVMQNEIENNDNPSNGIKIVCDWKHCVDTDIIKTKQTGNDQSFEWLLWMIAKNMHFDICWLCAWHDGKLCPTTIIIIPQV